MLSKLASSYFFEYVGIDDFHFFLNIFLHELYILLNFARTIRIHFYLNILILYFHLYFSYI